MVGKGGLPPPFRIARFESSGGKPPFPTSNVPCVELDFEMTRFEAGNKSSELKSFMEGERR